LRNLDQDRQSELLLFWTLKNNWLLGFIIINRITCSPLEEPDFPFKIPLSRWRLTGNDPLEAANSNKK
jgi:hypothetical protein